MSWEAGIQISIFGFAFLLAYIAFNITDEAVESQLLKLLLIGFSIVFGFAGIGVNFGIIDATGIPFLDSSRLMHSLKSVYIPALILLILFLAFSLYIVVKKIKKGVEDTVKIKSGEKEENED